MTWGASSHRKGRKLSAATRAKISAALKGRKRTGKKTTHPKTAKQAAAARANLAKARAAQKGRPRTAKQIAAAKANLAKGRAKALANRKGKPLSAATRAKISAALKGKHHTGHPLSPAARAKISAALKGRKRTGHPMSAATKAKLSAALKGRHHSHGTTRPRSTRPTAPKRPYAAHRSAVTRKTKHTGFVRHGKTHHKRHAPRHPMRGLISAHQRRHLKGFLHKGTRHHRYRPVVRRRIRAHRVWKRRRRR